MYDLISFKDVQWITDPRDQLKKGKEINIKNLRNGKIKQRYRYHKTHERAVFLKSFGSRKNGRDLCFPPPPLFHYYFTIRRTHVRGTWGSKPFYVSPFKLDSSLPHLALGQPRVSRANNGQGQIIFAPQPLSPTSGMERRHSPISSSSTGTSGRR